MKWRIQNGRTRLRPYQRQLVERLAPILERIDDERVTGRSGLVAREAGTESVVVLTVEARPEGVPALILDARPDQCILGFGNSEILECHARPGADAGLIDEVIALVERYLSGVTVIEGRNASGGIVRVDYFYGLDSEWNAESRIGSDTFPLVFPRTVASTVKRSFRFLRDESPGDRDADRRPRGM